MVWAIADILKARHDRSQNHGVYSDRYVAFTDILGFNDIVRHTQCGHWAKRRNTLVSWIVSHSFGITKRRSAWKADKCSARSSLVFNATFVISCPGNTSRRDQAAEPSRGGCVNDRSPTYRPLFRSNQDRQPVRPDRPLGRTR